MRDRSTGQENGWIYMKEYKDSGKVGALVASPKISLRAVLRHPCMKSSVVQATVSLQVTQNGRVH